MIVPGGRPRQSDQASEWVVSRAGPTTSAMNRRQISSQDKRDHVVRRGPVCVFVGVDDGEEGVGRHREGDPAGPGGTAADLVLIQPARPW